MKNQARDKGFTLIEVVAALAILSGAVVMLLSSFNYHLGAAARSRDEVLSTVLGMEKIEEMRLAGGKGGLEGDFGEAYPEFRWTLLEEDSGLKGVKRNEFKVTNGKGAPISLVYFSRDEE
ncbi:MAG: hypothetical protein A2054_05365 [Deltaproteobacteria bacterium GWA2_55_10]|nr:MAG: hypothetical protein A2054_05365 [Deltaproteobacteria bacterium GWA2_55_10]